MNFQEGLYELGSLINYFGVRRFFRYDEDKFIIYVYCSGDTSFREGGKDVPSDLETCPCIKIKVFKHTIRVRYKDTMAGFSDKQFGNFDDVGYNLMVAIEDALILSGDHRDRNYL